MKAITLWQPWASLIACGTKKYETRSWSTNYRGPIAIHAAKISPSRVIDSIFGKKITDERRNFLKYVRAGLGGKPVYDVPLGVIIATADLVDCHKIVRYGGRGMSSQSTGWLETESGIYMPTVQEELFGDWMPGRYAWEFQNIQMLPEPIPAKGKQRLWEWSDNREMQRV